MCSIPTQNLINTGNLLHCCLYIKIVYLTKRLTYIKHYSEILTNRLLQLVEKSSDSEATLSKYVSNDVPCHSTFEKEEDLIQFQEVSNILVTSTHPVKHETEKDIPFVEIPDLYPVKHTITMPVEHFYKDYSKYRKYTMPVSMAYNIFLLKPAQFII